MAWAHVANDKVANSAPGNITSQAVTWTADTTAGNRAIIGIFISPATGLTPTVTSITDPRGNTWSLLLAKTQVSGSITRDYEIWSAQIQTKILATDSLTVNFSVGIGAGSGVGWWTGEYSGLDTSSAPVDVSSSNSTAGPNATVTSGSTAPTTAANELVLRIFGDGGANVTWTTAPLGTVAVNGMGNTNADTWCSYGDSGAVGSTPDANGTESAAHSWTSIVLVLKLGALGVYTGTGPFVSNLPPVLGMFPFTPTILVPPPAPVFPSSAVVIQKRKVILRRSSARVASQTPTIAGTPAIAIQKRRVIVPRRASLATAAPQTPTASATVAVAAQKRKVRVPGKVSAATIALQTPTATATTALGVQKRRVKASPPRATVAPQTPTVAATSAASVQKRRVHKAQPTALIAPVAATTVPSTGAAATQKRKVKPQRPTSSALIAAQTPTVAATGAAAIQKPRLRLRRSRAAVGASPAAPPTKGIINPLKTTTVNTPLLSTRTAPKLSTVATPLMSPRSTPKTTSIPTKTTTPGADP
jgi:hypothetical protein